MLETSERAREQQLAIGIGDSQARASIANRSTAAVFLETILAVLWLLRWREWE